MLNLASWSSYASNSMSTINSFSPGTSQINFVSVETVKTLDHKKFSFVGFVDSSYQSLAIYNSSQSGNDVLSFTHMGLSYGLSPKLEIGLKGSAIFNQTSDPSQSSLILRSQGFVNIDGFVKYRLFDSVKSGLTLMAQLGVANGDEIFYVGSGSGLNSSISVLYEKSIGPWLLAANLGYIQRNPGEQVTLPYFEPIRSTTLGSLGIGRPLTQKTRVSAELLLASHSFVQDNSDRGSLAAETLFSFHTKFKALNLSYGLGTGLTNGISTPTLRGFLGFQYPFGLDGMLMAQKRKIKDEENDQNSIEDVVKSDKDLKNESEAIAKTGQRGEGVGFEEESKKIYFEGNQGAGPPTKTKVDDLVVREVSSNTEDLSFRKGQKSREDLEQGNETKQTEVLSELKGAHKFILNNIKFAFDSAKLDSDSINTLRKVLEEIKKQSYTKIKILGHTDYYGPSAYNEYLGLRRAKAVYDFFESHGVSKSIIDFDAFGERRPLSAGSSRLDRQKNRRVEVVVSRDSSPSVDENDFDTSKFRLSIINSRFTDKVPRSTRVPSSVISIKNKLENSPSQLCEVVKSNVGLELKDSSTYVVSALKKAGAIGSEDKHFSFVSPHLLWEKFLTYRDFVDISLPILREGKFSFNQLPEATIVTLEKGCNIDGTVAIYCNGNFYSTKFVDDVAALENRLNDASDKSCKIGKGFRVLAEARRFL